MTKKRSSSFPKLSFYPFYLAHESRFWTISKQPVFNKETFGNDTKMFWFRFPNDIGTFALSFFWHYCPEDLLELRQLYTNLRPFLLASTQGTCFLRQCCGYRRGSGSSFLTKCGSGSASKRPNQCRSWSLTQSKCMFLSSRPNFFVLPEIRLLIMNFLALYPCTLLLLNLHAITR